MRILRLLHLLQGLVTLKQRQHRCTEQGVPPAVSRSSVPAAGTSTLSSPFDDSESACRRECPMVDVETSFMTRIADMPLRKLKP